MLVRIQEFKGHNAAIYDLLSVQEGFYSVAADGYLVYWKNKDESLGHVVARVEGGKFLSLCALPDGGFVAGTLQGEINWLYPDKSDKNRHMLKHRLAVFSLQIHRQILFSAGGDGVLTTWSLESKEPLTSLQLSTNSLRCIAIDPVHQRMAIGASDGNIYLMDASGTRVLDVVKAHSPSVFTLIFSKNGKHLYSGGRDAQIALWSVEDKLAEVERVNAHLSTVNHLALHPEGRWLASASRDKTLKIWDTEPGLRLIKVAEGIRDRGHVNSVNTVCWQNDSFLLSAGDDRRILRWSFDV